MKLTKKGETEILQVMDTSWESYLKAKLDTLTAFLPDDYRNNGTRLEEIGNSKKEIVDCANELVDQMVMVHEPVDMYVKLNEKIEIRVVDNGNGVPDSAKDKIFQPFFTTKPTGQGTGLGLSLSYDIITKGHGGVLKVNTKPGEGTELIIQLPLNNSNI